MYQTVRGASASACEIAESGTTLGSYAPLPHSGTSGQQARWPGWTQVLATELVFVVLTNEMAKGGSLLNWISNVVNSVVDVVDGPSVQVLLARPMSASRL